MRRLSSWLVAVLLLGACASTKVFDIWKDPRFAGPPLRSVLVCSLHPDDATRRLLDDSFVKALAARGIPAVPCYLALPPGPPTETTLREAVARAGASGVLITQLAGVSVANKVEPGPGYYWPLYESFGPTWNAVYGPGYLQSETKVQLQTKAYRTANGGELVWFGMSQTFNPSSVNDLASDAAPKLIEAMSKAGVLPVVGQG